MVFRLPRECWCSHAFSQAMPAARSDARGQTVILFSKCIPTSANMCTSDRKHCSTICLRARRFAALSHTLFLPPSLCVSLQPTSLPPARTPPAHSPSLVLYPQRERDEVLPRVTTFPSILGRADLCGVNAHTDARASVIYSGSDARVLLYQQPRVRIPWTGRARGLFVHRATARMYERVHGDVCSVCVCV